MRTLFYRSNAQIFRYAHKLRANMTVAEKILWHHLSKSKLNGYRFKRQHPIKNYIADFYCHKAKLIIEIDGGIHDQEDQIIRDRERTAIIEALDCRVIRFRNSEVMNEIEHVLASIKTALPPATTAASPSGEVGGADITRNRHNTI